MPSTRCPDLLLCTGIVPGRHQQYLVLWHYDPANDIDDQSHTWWPKRQAHHEHANQRYVESEVSGDAGADPGNLLFIAGAAEQTSRLPGVRS